jgi:16S rRNA processing protein RimM
MIVVDLNGCYIRINRKDSVSLEENAYFIVDLINLDVVTTEGNSLGKVEDVFPTGSNDVYVVKDKLGKQILIPAISSVVKNVDLNKKVITVELLRGLVDSDI